jgi:hypothetical protein
MKRRSFISAMAISSLAGVRLWDQPAKATAAAFGAPRLMEARGEYQRVVLSFQPVDGAESYEIRVRASTGSEQTISGVEISYYSVQGLENGIRYTFQVAAVGPNGATPFGNPLEATPTEEMPWPALHSAFLGDNPTRSSCPFWMVHGAESDQELRQSMRQIYRFGFEGVTLHPYDYQDFLGQGNWSRWRVITDEARKLGLTVWEQDDKDYPCGYAAGKVVERNREWGRWEVYLAQRQTVEGPSTLNLDTSQYVLGAQILVAVSALSPQGPFTDLTQSVQSGKVSWSVPAGTWQVFVISAGQPGLDHPKGYPDLVRGEMRGYIDPLSPAATDALVEAVLAATSQAVGSEALGSTWKGFYIDEPGFYSSGSRLGEQGVGFPYTPDLLARFSKRYGYDLRPFLPLLWVEHGPQTARVRYDYMDFVSTGYADLFIGKQRRFAEQHRMQVNGHVREDMPFQLGGGTGSNFRTLEAFSMGGFDHIFDQWYTPEDDVYWRQSKMASSISHTLQTPQDEAMVEHFAATGWRTGLTEMKAMMDWTTTRGVSRIVPCGLDTQRPPVWEDQPEFWLHGENPLAPYFHAYQVIANRGTMMIHGGRHVARAVLLDNAESAWAGTAEELWRSCKALSQAHFDFDMVSYGVFADTQKCQFHKGRVHIGGEDYEFVILPGADAVPVAVMSRLAAFFQQGGTVITLGPGARVASDPQFKRTEIVPRLPFRSPDGRNDTEVKDYSAAIWGPKAQGRGRAFITTYKDLANLLYGLDAHDVWVEPNLQMLQYYHRRLSGRDVYLFNNEGAPISTVIKLRGARGVPEFWDAVGPSIRQAPCYDNEDEGLRVRLQLARYESLFVVINPQAKPLTHLKEAEADEVLREDKGDVILRQFHAEPVRYTTSYASGRSSRESRYLPGPLPPSLELAEEWERTETQGNTAVYHCGFNWPNLQPCKAVLQIEGMTQVISASLNGHDLGTRFTYPFRFDAGPELVSGTNRLELRHTERYQYKSALGRIKLLPYYEWRVAV